MSFEALPLARTDLEPVKLPTVGPADAPVCAVLPESLGLDDEPWLVVLRQDAGVRVEPVAVGGRRTIAGEKQVSVRAALRLADPVRRAEKVEEALFEMVDEQDASRAEEDWSFLTDMMLCMEDLPPTAFDLLSVLPRCPEMLVRCLFQLDANLREKVWRLDDELPFSWLLVPRKIWRREAVLAYEDLRGQLAGVVDESERLASERVLSILDEGAVPCRGAWTQLVRTSDVTLAGGALSEELERAICEERDRRTQKHVNLLASLDDWPPGRWSA